MGVERPSPCPTLRVLPAPEFAEVGCDPGWDCTAAHLLPLSIPGAVTPPIYDLHANLYLRDCFRGTDLRHSLTGMEGSRTGHKDDPMLSIPGRGQERPRNYRGSLEEVND